MARDRGTDHATERRQLRPIEENDSVGAFLEDLFDGYVEVGVLGLPVLVLVVLSGDLRLTGTAMVTTAALGVVVAHLGSGRVVLGPAWPPTTVRLLIPKAVYYNLVYLVALYVGLFLTVNGPGGLAGALAAVGGAGAVGVLGGLALPFLAGAVRSLVS